MANEVSLELKKLGGETSRVDVSPHRLLDVRGESIEKPLGQAVQSRKRPGSPVHVFLGIHIDTVYGPQHPFQRTQRIDENTLAVRPGVLDAKGGLCVLLTALAALEQSPFAEKIGWEVLINPDEEIGSPGSTNLLERIRPAKSSGPRLRTGAGRWIARLGPQRIRKFRHYRARPHRPMPAGIFKPVAMRSPPQRHWRWRWIASTAPRK